MTRTYQLKLRFGAGLLLTAAVFGLGPGATSAQERDVPAGVQTEVPLRRVSPRGAFLRSMVLPGWGQSAVGSYSRGGFYFATEAAVGWMIFKTSKRRGSARTVLGLREAEAEASHRAAGITDPLELLDLIEADPSVTDARDLEEVRAQQLEDWFAFGVFMLFLGGADAFVAAHLSDFPEALSPGFQVLPDGGVEASMSIPWNGPGG